MQMKVSAIVLHQYDVSPFSEKVRVALGIKGLEWHACEQPAIMPKPELLELTGGYRRIPVLQIGADLYFDSLLIIDELERRFPSPSIYGGCGRGMGHALNVWSDQAMFWPVVMALFGGDWDYDDAFVTDRSAMSGQPFDRAAMIAAAPAAENQLRGHLDLIDRQLADGRAFLFGGQPDIADAIAYYNLAFIRHGQGRTARLLADYANLLAWETRIRAIGHGKRQTDVSRTSAIEIARITSPAPIVSRAARDGLSPGDKVRIVYNDANSAPLEATILAADDWSISVRPLHSKVGEINIHMPRSAAAITRS